MIALPAIVATTADRHYVKLQINLALTTGTQASAIDPSTAAQVIRTSLASETLADVSPSFAIVAQRLARQFKAALNETYSGRVEKVLVLQVILQ